MASGLIEPQRAVWRIRFWRPRFAPLWRARAARVLPWIRVRREWGVGMRLPVLMSGVVCALLLTASDALALTVPIDFDDTCSEGLARACGETMRARRCEDTRGRGARRNDGCRREERLHEERVREERLPRVGEPDRTFLLGSNKRKVDNSRYVKLRTASLHHLGLTRPGSSIAKSRSPHVWKAAFGKC